MIGFPVSTASFAVSAALSYPINGESKNGDVPQGDTLTHRSDGRAEETIQLFASPFEGGGRELDEGCKMGTCPKGTPLHTDLMGEQRKPFSYLLLPLREAVENWMKGVPLGHVPE